MKMTALRDVVKITYVVPLLFLSGNTVSIGANLPPCSGNYWNNCFGAFTFENGQIYAGEWKSDKRNGQGTNTFPTGEIYVGEFKNDKFNGQGTFTYPTGEIYVGEFKNDKRNGQGTFKFPDGRTFSGLWQEDKLVDDRKADEPNPPSAKTSDPPKFTLPSDKKPDEKSPSNNGNITGTAFRIQQNQYITNNHVIKNCKEIKIGENSKIKVVGIDKTNDLALLSGEGLNGEIAYIRNSRIQLNETVTVAGFPFQGLFSDIAITNGTVTRLSGIQGDTSRIQISAPVQPGNSGGPLLDSAGNVIGVVSEKLNALKMAEYTGDVSQNINFAISSNALRAFLDSKGVNYKEIGREPDLKGEEIAKKAVEFTVLVECN